MKLFKKTPQTVNPKEDRKRRIKEQRPDGTNRKQIIR